MNKQEKIRQVLDIVKAGDDVKNTMVALMHELVKDHDILTPEDVPNSLLQALADVIEVDKLLDLYAPIYDAVFSESEIDDFLAYLQTPISAKIRSVMPDIVTRCSIIGRVWIEGKAGEIEGVIEKYLGQTP